MVQDFFKLKTANFNKLKTYGFVKNKNVYEFETLIFNNQFILKVYINNKSEVSTKVIDSKTQEEYVLHLVETAVGEFVGKVRTEFERVLTNISEQCFEKNVFKSNQAKQVIEYIKNKYDDDLEYLWEKFPDNAIWRRADNKKWYGLLIVLPKAKLGISSLEICDVLGLRIKPEDVKRVVDNKQCFEGYHMNKKSWFTICLDGSVEANTIFKFIDESYNLALKK